LALNVEWDTAGIYTDAMICGYLRRSDAFWSVHCAASGIGCRIGDFASWPISTARTVNFASSGNVRFWPECQSAAGELF